MSTKASISFTAAILRQSHESQEVVWCHCQFLPPSVLRPTVPAVPESQITLSFTTERPRKLAVVPDLMGVSLGACEKAVQ